MRSRDTSRRFSGVWLSALVVAVSALSCTAQDDRSLPSGMGLVAQNQFVTEIGGLPVGAVYLRGDFREPGRPFLWPRLEPEPGRYDFSSILDVLHRADSLGLKVGIRVITAHPFALRTNPDYPFFPSWIAYREVRRGNRVAQAPKWEDPRVQRDIRNLLMALGAAIRDHPALLFVDVGVLGWVGEWHTTVGFQNDDFMPSEEVKRQYIDMHIDAFGADKLLLNLGAMEPEILSYGLKRGINGVRQDCFGSSYHMRQYDAKLRAVPELQRVIDTGMVVFEVCGMMQDWTNAPGDPNDVTMSAHDIMDVAIRWKTTLFSNLGAPIPDRFRAEYERLEGAMRGYAPRKRISN